jgi:hypothetical protein
VVGDLVGQGAAEQEAVFGETPNLAARLGRREMVGIAGPFIGEAISITGTLSEGE